MRFMRKAERRAVPPLFFPAYKIELKKDYAALFDCFFPQSAEKRSGIFKNVSRETQTLFPKQKIKGEKPSFSVFFCRNTSIRSYFRRCAAAYLNLIPSAYFLGFP